MVVRSGTLSRTLQRFSLAVAAVAEAAVVVAVVLVVSVEALGRDGAWSFGAQRHHLHCSGQQLARRELFCFGYGQWSSWTICACMVARSGTPLLTLQRSAPCEEATNWLQAVEALDRDGTLSCGARAQLRRT